jgi:hypothetical protein
MDLVILTFREKFYRYESKQYGIKEAFFFPKGFEYYSRYTDVVNTLFKSAPKNPTILDIGAGGRGGISYFFSQNSSQIVLLDRERPPKSLYSKYQLIGDGLLLPFNDRTFDVVVSVATLEHIPQTERSQLLTEFRRVSKLVILHFPCKDTKGIFKGDKADLAFQNYYVAVFGREDIKTAEHQRSGHPLLEEVEIALPGSMIIGRKNCNVWLRCASFTRLPVIGFLGGLLYLSFWRKSDNTSPYYECLVIYKQKDR